MGVWRTEIRQQLKLALPITFIQIAMMGLGVTDTILIGRFSPEHLAAVAIGHGYFFLIASFALGVLWALDPIVAQAFGAKDRLGMARGIQRGLWLGLLLSLPIGVLVFQAERAFELFNQPPEVIPLGSSYAKAVALGLPGWHVFIVLRQGLQAMHRLRPIVFVILFTLVCNAVLDWALIFGHLGLPVMGAVGCGIATAICHWIMAIGLLVVSWDVLRDYLRPVLPESFAPRPLLRTLRLGLPIGAQFTLEIGAFASITFMMGSMGTFEVAGNQVALQLASLSFMVPLGISSAAAVRVGNGVGAGDAAGVRRSAVVAIIGGAGVMLVFASFFALVPGALARIYTDEPEVIAVAVLLLPLAALFQVFDGTQVVAAGILRGIGETLRPMLTHLVGFWVIGIPLGWYLAFRAGMGPPGLWWGLVTGLAFVAAVLVLFVRSRVRSTLERVAVEDGAPTGGSPGKAAETP